MTAVTEPLTDRQLATQVLGQMLESVSLEQISEELAIAPSRPDSEALPIGDESGDIPGLEGIKWKEEDERMRAWINEEQAKKVVERRTRPGGEKGEGAIILLG